MEEIGATYRLSITPFLRELILRRYMLKKGGANIPRLSRQ
jgi:hypothetical protein